MKICEVFEFLNSLFPVETAEDFDNVGLLIGNGENEVTGCVVALDCTKDAIKEAIKCGANLIITHHPVIFEPIKSLCDGSITALCIKNNITVISMHTNMDKGEKGVNYYLCQKLGLINCERFLGYDMFPLLKGDLPKAMSEEDLAHYLKNCLGGSVRYNTTGKSIKTIGICSGSGSGYIYDAINNSCDALITGDVKHNVFVDAQNEGFPVFDAGHFYTEDIIVEPLSEILRNRFPEISFIAHHGYNVKLIV